MVSLRSQKLLVSWCTKAAAHCLHCVADSGNGKEASMASPVSTSSRSETSQLALDASSNHSMQGSRAKAAESSPDTTTKRKREQNIQAMLGGS